MLTYSIYYTPSYDVIKKEDINFLCSDNKIHFRFRDFTKEEIIIGFEKKLTYLMTYLMNYSYLPTIIGQYKSDVVLQEFLKTSEINEIYNVVKLFTNEDKFRGFKAAQNYKRVHITKPFGEVDNNCFPLNASSKGLKEKGSLNIFLKKLKINLYDYLFNDSYVIVLREVTENKFNEKFTKKQLKKINKINNDLIKLW